MTIRKLVQAALDSTGVKSFWKRRVKVKGDTDPDEYIVYTLGSDSGTDFADNVAIQKEAEVTVRYYCRSDRFSTEKGRAAAEARVEDILAALNAAEISTPSGAFDAGDIDDTGYDAVVIECAYRRVM